MRVPVAERRREQQRVKALWIPHSLSPAYAGVRLRCLIPSAILRSQGHAVSVTMQVRAQRCDAAVVQAKWLLDAGGRDELTLRMQELLQLKRQGSRLLLDSFDNYFLNHDKDPARAALLAAYRECLPHFDAFVVSSPGLVPFLRSETGPALPIVVVGDPLEHPGANALYESRAQRLNPRRWPLYARAAASVLRIRRDRKTHRQLIWFGNHGAKYASGGMSELIAIRTHLESAARQVPLHLRVVSNSLERYQQILSGARFDHSYAEWNRLSFPELLREHDLVVLPSAVTSFTAAKSNNRLLLPLSLGIPVVADGLPDYLPWKAFFALGNWNRLAETLHDLDAVRARAASSRQIVLDMFSPQVVAQRWWTVIESVVGGRLVSEPAASVDQARTI